MIEQLWPAPPPTLQLTGAEVHVWRAVLDQPSLIAQRLATLLAPDEQARAARFHFAHDRLHFSVARAALRVLLGTYLGCEARAIRFQYGPQGKPALEFPRSDLAFNLSHSGGVALLAFAQASALGVDVERFRAMDDRLNIAQHFFSPAECQVLRQLPPSEQEAGFFRCWTRKEAYIKAVGGGLSIPLDSFDVAFAPNEPAALLAVRGAGSAQAWHISNLEPGPQFAGALVVAGGGWQVRTWEWLPPA